MKPLRERLAAAFRGFPPVFWTLLAGLFVNRLASFVVTFLALYLVRERGFEAAAAGRIVALFGVGMLVAGPLGGTLADAIGRRATMLLSLGVGSLVVGTIGFLRDPAALAVFTFLAALTNEAYRPAVNAAIVDVVAPQDRARAWGLTYWTVNLGWTFGLALGGLLASRSFTALFLADAATSLVFAAIVARWVPETRPPGRKAQSPVAGLLRVFSDRPFVVFLLLNLTTLVVFVQFQLAAPVDMTAHGLGPGWFAALMSLNGLGVVVLQPLAGPAIARRDSARTLAASALLIGGGFGIYAFADLLPALPLYALGVVLWTVGEVVGFPAAATVVADLAPADLRGRYQGAFSMSWGLSFTIAPILGGQVLTSLGAPALWGICFAVGALVAWGHLRAGGPRRARLAAMKVAAARAEVGEPAGGRTSVTPGAEGGPS